MRICLSTKLGGRVGSFNSSRYVSTAVIESSMGILGYTDFTSAYHPQKHVFVLIP